MKKIPGVSGVSRRDFLHASMVAGAGVSLAGALPPVLSLELGTFEMVFVIRTWNRHSPRSNVGPPGNARVPVTA